jgi:putative transposase
VGAPKGQRRRIFSEVAKFKRNNAWAPWSHRFVALKMISQRLRRSLPLKSNLYTRHLIEINAIKMPNTYTQLLTQLVFAVKGRQNLIEEPVREKVEKYICGTVKKRKHKPLAIYCMPDHLHFLIGLSPDQSISDLVKGIKISSNDLINDNKLTKQHFYWQEGYGAFSYSRSALDNVVKYILNQKEHHKKKTFKEEYIDFLEKFGVAYDEKYLFEFYQ